MNTKTRRRPPIGECHSARLLRAFARASFAWINAQGKDPYPYYDLNRQSMSMWTAFAEEFGDDGLEHGGELCWAVSEPEAETIRSRVDLL